MSSIFYEQLFHQYYFSKELQSQTVTREKLRKTLLYKNGSRKMLMKLAQGCMSCFTHQHCCVWCQTYLILFLSSACQLSYGQLQKKTMILFLLTKRCKQSKKKLLGSSDSLFRTGHFFCPFTASQSEHRREEFVYSLLLFLVFWIQSYTLLDVRS